MPPAVEIERSGGDHGNTLARARLGSVYLYNRLPVFLIGSFEDRTINRSAHSKVARRSERFLRRLPVGAEDCRLRSRGHEGNRGLATPRQRCRPV